MTVFLANRENLQTRRLHDRISSRLQSDPAFTAVRRERTSARDPGAYRVVAGTDPESFLDVSSYPTSDARIEVGFDLAVSDSDEHYWFNWLEPTRGLLVGWHRDATHEDLGPVHLQVNDGGESVVHEPATFFDAHPLAVVERRLATLPTVVRAVEWADGRPTGLDR
jgi:hypothetical protein